MICCLESSRIPCIFSIEQVTKVEERLHRTKPSAVNCGTARTRTTL